MLVSFSVTNSRSIKDEMTLDLSRMKRRHSSNEYWDEWEPYSPVAGIYGANASGKSNFIGALSFFRRAVAESHTSWSPDDPIPLPARFALSPGDESSPSRFEIVFVLDGVRYQYGFEADPRRVVKEWLYSFPEKRQRIVFERDTTAANEPWYFGDSLRGRARVISDLTRRNSLFLSAAASNNHELLGTIHQWIKDKIAFAGPTDHERRLAFSVFQLQNDETARRNILALLKSADLGIDDIEFKLPDVPEAQVAEVLKQIEADPEFPQDADRPVDADRVRLAIAQANAGVELTHRAGGSQAVPLPLEEESYGTRALLGLAGPIYECLEFGRTLVIDEIDTSLHPVLVRAIVKVFKSKSANRLNAQLIFSSHDVTLLMQDTFDEALLDRDQIWFSEKNDAGESTLYPLTDFKPRASHSLLRGYLQGRYGAVPRVDWRDMWELEPGDARV